MQLTNEQAEIARAEGCRFVPATEAQVRQFSMQRRIFTIGGQPFLAARQDGFYETAGTLTRLISEAERHGKAAAPPPEALAAEAAAEPEPAPEAALEPEVEPEAAAEVEDVVTDADEVEEDEEPAAAMVAVAPMLAQPAATQLPAPVMAATVTIVKGYARRAPMDPAQLTALVSTVHGALRRLR